MTPSTDRRSCLQVDLHVSSRPIINFPFQEGCEWRWSGIANTLIYDADFALLVDTSLTRDQNIDLVAWIRSVLGSQRNLTHIFITHGHRDHYFGIPTVLDAFPHAQVLTTKTVKSQIESHTIASSGLWLSLFPDDQLDWRENWTVTTVSDNAEFHIQDHTFRAMTVEQGDCPHASILFVPEIALICAGDVVIATHLYLAESTTREARLAWLRALDQIQALGAHLIIPGHMRAGQVPVGNIMLDHTRRYLRVWEEELNQSSNSDDLFMKMKARFPGLLGDFVLKAGCDAAFQKEVHT